MLSFGGLRGNFDIYPPVSLKAFKLVYYPGPGFSSGEYLNLGSLLSKH